MSDVVSAIRDEVNEALSKDELELPTLPEVALRIRETAEQEDVSIKDLADVIGEDPGLSAQVIRIANSPLYRGVSEAGTVQMAISRLGMDFTRNLTTGLAMQQMFQATNDVIDRKLRSVWNHATQVAAISSALARNCTRLKPDLATLAGLTHNIGVLPVLTWAEEHGRLHDSISLDAVVEKLQGQLGTLILTKWEFPAELLCVPEEHNKYDRQRDKADYADVVMVANLQSYVGTNHPNTELDWHAISAFQRLGLDPDVSLTEVDELAADLEAAESLFN